MSTCLGPPSSSPIDYARDVAGRHVLTGAAGEDYVLFELHRRGVLAAQTPTNAYLADILVFDPEMSVGAMVQVKARNPGGEGWAMTEKHERARHPRLFYVFVDLGTSPPTSYVVPAAVVADVITLSHKTWLGGPGRGGRVRNDSPVRRLRRDYGFPVPGFPAGWLDAYRERWDHLLAPPRRAGDEAGA